MLEFWIIGIMEFLGLSNDDRKEKRQILDARKVKAEWMQSSLFLKIIGILSFLLFVFIIIMMIYGTVVFLKSS